MAVDCRKANEALQTSSHDFIRPTFCPPTHQLGSFGTWSMNYKNYMH
jgi:hypothetical protein